MDKSILITGASSGIGYHTALLLKQHHYRVFATARKAHDVERLQAEGFESLQLDVVDAKSIYEAVTEIRKRTNNHLYALFNNAGFIQPGAIEDLTPNMIYNQFATNVFGAMEVIRQVLPIMRAQGYGRIIQNSSILGVVTLPYYGAYNASKYALEGFSSTLRQELRGTDIFVSLINPGPIRSQLRQHAYDLYQNELRGKHGPHHLDAYQKLEQFYVASKERKDRFMLEPQAVAKVVLKILTSKRPKAHYFITLPARGLALLRRLLPDAALDWLLSKTR